ncbi:MAG: rod shape-determining protein MreD [Anaerolineae bacterium]
MGHWLGLPILAFAAILQSTFIPQIRVFGGQPDLVLLFVLSWAVSSSLEEAVTWAFIGGFAADLMSAAPTGTSILGLIFIVFLVERLKGQVVNINILVLVGLTLAAAFIQLITQMVILGVTGTAIRPVDQFFYIILPSVVYNVIFIAPVYWFTRRIKRLLSPGRRMQRRSISES